MPTLSLLCLPNELIVNIAGYLEVEDPLTLAVLSETCRRINSCCRELVALRGELDKKYRVIHDRDPFNVPNLLKRASRDVMREAWHVRRAEFWGNRTHTSKDWCQTSDFVCSPWSTEHWRNPIWFGENFDDDKLWKMDPETGAKWFDEALDREVKEVRALHARGCELLQRDEPMYRMMLQKRFHLTEVYTEDLIRQTLSGEEELLKALLLPLCKNLHTLIIFQFAIGAPHSSEPLYLLCLLIQQSRLNKTSGRSPPAFMSLRKISINSETDAREKPLYPTRMERTGEMYFVDLRKIEQLFALPNLKVLRVACVGSATVLSDWFDSGPKLTSFVEPGTSSVEALEIAKSDLTMEQTHHLLSLPKRLRYLQTDDPYTPMLLRSLHGCPATLPRSLERLKFRSTMGEKLWVLANYTSLRQAEALTADCLVWRPKTSAPVPTGPQERFRFPAREKDEDPNSTVALEALELTLPPNVETLSIHFWMESGNGLGFFNAFIRELLRNVFGNAKNDAHTGAAFPHLRQVTFLLQDGSLPKDFEWDEDALESLRARKIEVSHTEIPSARGMSVYEDVDESQWEHCLEDRYYTDPRHEVEGYEGRKFGVVRTYQDLSAWIDVTELDSDYEVESEDGG